MVNVSGIVFRCKDRIKTAAFYAAFGLDLNEHQHGGPVHIEVCPWGTPVLELYNESPSYPRDALLIEVTDMDKVLNALRDLGVVPRMDRKFLPNRTVIVYVQDPDGRDVMISQNPNPQT